MKTTKVNILGTEYNINTEVTQTELEEQDLYVDELAGLCDSSTKDIFIRLVEPDATSIKNLNWFYTKVIRHEVIHAFLIESGLAENSEWADNEEMVDYFAAQMPKMIKVFKELNVDE